MEKRTLLQKYEIPISHLDFDYIKNSKNVKELERIVEILRSGEEGYYPDLTKCAEDKLRELKPQSRALRTEERLITKNSLSSKDWEEHKAPISEWSMEIKNKDSILSTIQKNSENNTEIQLPTIRKGGKFDTKKIIETNLEKKSNKTPVATTNYSQWDKYDADSEILKMDLEEERCKEEVERLNRINQKKFASGIEVIVDNKSNIYDKLSIVEKEKLAEDCKIRGNEYFKSKEYKNALEQYSRCIEILPSVAGYNNRAITNLKLQKYSDALADSTECLQLDKSNLKAWLRKAEAYLGMGWKHDAFRTYEQIKLIEPTNAIACTALESLRKELGEVAPIHATRLQIMESDTSNEKSIVKYKPPKTVSQQPKPSKDYDLAELIKPNKVVKNNLLKTMESLGKAAPKAGQKIKAIKEIPKKPQFQDSTPDIRLEIDAPRARQGGKMLIQEL